MEQLQQELERCHTTIKESTDYPVKRHAAEEAAYLTARYLHARYQLEGLYNYRRIERMAEQLPEMVAAQLQTADRYSRAESSWRADIAINSLGLDLYIMHTGADEIAEDSGAIVRQEYRRRHPLLTGLLRRVRVVSSMWSGKHRRSDTAATVRAAERLEALLENSTADEK